MWGTVFPVKITSENRWFDADRFRGGTGIWLWFRFRNPIGRSPQTNAGFRKLGERGASMAEQEALPNGRCHGLPGEVSRSIWPSKLGLSSYRILPARGILSFGGKVRLLLYVCIRVMKFNNKPMRHQNRPNRQKSTFLSILICYDSTGK